METIREAKPNQSDGKCHVSIYEGTNYYYMHGKGESSTNARVMTVGMNIP
jgi:hypothetical protein